jgi:hypothetical protein
VTRPDREDSHEAVGASVVAADVIGIGSIGLAGVGVGLAAASGSGTIHGCVAKSNGSLRVVSSSKDCTSHEKAISFNKQGPQGPQGPQGIAGQSASSPTFQMYANVDGEGDLGSNYDAVSAKVDSIGYTVTFNRPIGQCAAETQPGKAGGSDSPVAATSVVDPDGPDGFRVAFYDSNLMQVSDAFMMTVTCTS